MNVLGSATAPIIAERAEPVGRHDVGAVAQGTSLMPEHDINVTRDGRWWMIAIPEIDGLTQAEDFDEIEVMARDYTDTPIDEIAVRIVGARP